MKNRIPYQIKIVLAIVVFIGLLCAVMLPSAKAQIGGTNGFLGTLQGWVMNNDTNNLCFVTNDVLELSSGVVNNNNQNIQAYMDVRANPYKGLAVGGRFYNDSILGSVAGVGGYVGYAVVDSAIRITPELEIGYKTGTKHGYVSPGLMAEKAMTQNTFTQLGLFMPVAFKGQQNFTPQVIVGVGFKF